MSELTPREREVVAYVARGWKNQKIASALGISVETVDRHIRNAAERIPGNGKPRYKCLLWFFNLHQEEDEAA